LLHRLGKKDTSKLGALISRSGEMWDQKDGRYPIDFPYIEISGVGLGTDEYSVLPVPTNEAPSRARQVVRTDDILVSLTRPHRGAIARVRDVDNGAIASTGFCILRHLLSEQVSKDFLMLALSSSVGLDQMLMRSSGGNYPAITEDELANVLIPIPATTNIQNNLVAAMESARAERRAKQAEADALLAGLDDYLLATLGLTPPPKDERKVFAVTRGAAPARFDPHFHLPAFAQILRMLTVNGGEPLGNIATFSNEIWTPVKHDAPTFRYIEISSVDRDTGEAHAVETPVAEAPSRARMAVHTGDIIVSLTRPHHGSIAQITPELDGCVASTGFSVIRNVDQSRVMNDYLWCILRRKMCLSQMLQRASGGNYPAITEPELAKVLIPVPTMDIQETIAAEARRRRDEARRLRAEADAGWQAAKRWFEEQLLGAAQP